MEVTDYRRPLNAQEAFAFKDALLARARLAEGKSFRYQVVDDISEFSVVVDGSSEWTEAQLDEENVFCEAIDTQDEPSNQGVPYVSIFGG